MEQGIILVSVRDGEEGENPFRTGAFVVVRERLIREAIQPQEVVDHVLKARFAFIPDDAWDKLGLPREVK